MFWESVSELLDVIKVLQHLVAHNSLAVSVNLGIVTGQALQLMPAASYLHHDGMIGSIAPKAELFQLKL